MGNTCSGLHIMRRANIRGDMSRNLIEVYAELGYEPAPNEVAGKQVIVADDGTARFITLLAADSAKLDSGELKQLAVKLSKRLSTVVIVTGVLDSDSFEFLLFHAGKQVDAILSETPAPDSKLKVLKGKRRLNVWLKMFMSPDIPEATSVTPSSMFDVQALASVVANMRAFEERMGVASLAAGAFADDSLSKWCEVVGLEPVQALTPFEDVARRSEAAVQNFSFAKVAGAAAPPAALTKTKTAPVLAWLRSNAESPYHRFYPSQWPIEPTAEQGCRWYVLSSAAGLDGFQLDLGIKNTGAVEIDLIGASAFPFYNGQITSMTPLAKYEQHSPLSVNAINVAPFQLPDLDPQVRKQIVIEIRLRYRAVGKEPFTLSPTLVADPSGVTLTLPPLTLQPVEPDWHPRIMTKAESRQTDARRRLNTPSVLSAVAMIDDDGAPVRRRVRTFAQRWLTALAPPTGATIEVATETHMNPNSFRVSKNVKRHLPDALHDDKLWKRLFESKSDYHTISFAVQAPDMPHPIAGLNVHAALNGTVGRMPGALLTVSTWILNEPSVFACLRTTPELLTELIETWLADETPIQAWVTRTAWIPEFDIYDEFRQTLYEEAADFDWFRSDMNGKLALREWADQHLRFVAPRMWLGAPLAGRLDLGELRSVADVISAAGQTLRLTLRPGHELARLEEALSPVLPPSS